MTMKKFNVNLDQKLNVLAVAFANGDQVAGNEFVEIVEPMLKSYARKQYSPMEKEDLVAEFMVVAVEKCFDFAERYNDGQNNVMGLIYTACKRKLIDINKSLGAEKRSLYKDREVSLQALVGEEGDMSMSEKVGSDEKSVEDQVIEKVTSETVKKVVNEFVNMGKGRHSKIVDLVYKANRLGWSQELLNNEIAEVLKAEKGMEPKADAIRQAKSRAMKELRKALELGNIQYANQLSWNF
jgi:DNA-directed RNA polymerase specialized sigma24 family protein